MGNMEQHIMSAKTLIIKNFYLFICLITFFLWQYCPSKKPKDKTEMNANQNCSFFALAPF